MAIKIQSTKDYGFDGVKILVYSPAGVGKTYMCSTAKQGIIISAEAGLLSLAGKDIPFIEVKSVSDIDEVYQWLTESKEADSVRTVCLDSITDIAERMLIEYKLSTKDGRQAYGDLFDNMSTIIRKFRDLRGKHVYFTAKQIRVTDDDGISSFIPGMPGRQLLNGLPYHFDEVFALRLGKLEDGSVYRYLQTYPDLQYEGKDRSGKMPPRAKPDLDWIFDRISGKTTEMKEAPEPVEDADPPEEEVKPKTRKKKGDK